MGEFIHESGVPSFSEACSTRVLIAQPLKHIRPSETSEIFFPVDVNVLF